MPAHPDHHTRAQLHLEYLRAMFQERNLSYCKKNPSHAADPAYLRALQARHQKAHPDGRPHLSSMTHLLALATLREFLLPSQLPPG